MSDWQTLWSVSGSEFRANELGLQKVSRRCAIAGGGLAVTSGTIFALSHGSATVAVFASAAKCAFGCQILAQSRWLAASVSGFGNGIGFGIANSPPAGGEHP
ncbi:MAG: hypothetical protein OXC63_02665 [Aestuariivita sp.]|nr:hypothetical protein [Aestuariivita sp.]MCY4347816.1 hypothetical protein [Aestuariivita sp.]